MVLHQRTEIQNHYGKKLVGILHDTGSKEVVMICHGILSSKDRIPMVSLAMGLENAGISAFRFDFIGYGESDGPAVEQSLDREIEDLHATIQYFREIGRAVTTIIGHSRGGNLVVLYASKYRDICRVVNMSSSVDFRGIFLRVAGKDYFEETKRYGYFTFKNKKGELVLRVNEDSGRDNEGVDMRSACLMIHENCRVLTIQGSMDQLVYVEDALLYDKLISNHVLKIVEGADHDFTSHQDELTSIVVDFVVKDMRRDIGSKKHSKENAFSRPRL